MTTTSAQPAAASAIPKASPPAEAQQSTSKDQDQNREITGKKIQIPKPKYRLHAEDLRHPESASFSTYIPDVAATLDTALSNIVRYLYTSPETGSLVEVESIPKRKRPRFIPFIPRTRSVTLFLRDFGGVAYTTGTELDDDHKEIHLSLPYITHCKNSAAKADPVHELAGVLTHELVHCYQHTSPPDSVKGEKDIPNPPGGLIEGIADFVRLKAGLSPPHWTRPTSSSQREKKWDAGYQHTAYFLAWIEDVWAGEGAVGMLNDRLYRVGYVGEGEKDEANGHEGGFWKSLFGLEVAQLWDEYGQWLDDGEKAKGNWEEEIVNPV
ncbi:PBSP domain protein [Penicillium brasilianum]|uniref:PBSP domain protein n=1 Tax=Penicillium brasilianum TaxID=104259 RepID=A0A1S9RBR4_PENBI|nr:PBSP domain protein [Penicillium brasilianum]